VLNIAKIVRAVRNTTEKSSELCDSRTDLGPCHQICGWFDAGNDCDEEAR